MLIGKTVEVVVSEPWEFKTVNGSGTFTGKVALVDEDAVVVDLASAVRCESDDYRSFLCKARTADSLVDELEAGHKCEAALTALPANRRSGADPFDLSWWRGGGALIGTVVLV